MRSLVQAVFGAVTAVVHVLVGGFIAVQMSAAEGGAVVDLTNTVVSVREPGPSPLAILALVVFGCFVLVLVGALPGQREVRGLAARLIAYVAVTLGLIVTALTVEIFPPEGFFDGPLGWLVEGGQDSSVQLSCAIAAMAVVVAFLSRRRADAKS